MLAKRNKQSQHRQHTRPFADQTHFQFSSKKQNVMTVANKNWRYCLFSQYRNEQAVWRPFNLAPVSGWNRLAQAISCSDDDVLFTRLRNRR